MKPEIEVGKERLQRHLCIRKGYYLGKREIREILGQSLSKEMGDISKTLWSNTPS